VRIAFIVQRYGTEILGGAEYACRLTAERLAAKHEVEVLTTCAQDYVTWKNEYPEGSDRIRGVTVRRFANSQTRDIEAFNRYSDWIFNNPHDAADEMEWLKQQGPWSPALLDYLKRTHKNYDTLIFYTYLYAPTVLGLQVDPGRSILVPTAHDEPPIRLGIYKDVFRLPKGIGYLTEVERKFVTDNFERTAAIEETVGCGVDLPPHHAYPRAATEETSDVTQPDAGQESEENSSGNRFQSHVSARGATFRRRHRVHGAFVLYGGRIDPGKGCEELIEYFSTYVQEGGDASLVLMGLKLMPLPEEPFINFAGLLSEQERLQALEAATVVVVPSPYESLSLLALEALAVGTPILCNARSEVLVDHCLRSNGGLFYADRDEFVESLKLLVADERLRAAMGRSGREYVRRNYRWDVVLGKLDRMIARIRQG
jgi:glycosyltransferase involved in cell wall biosynthesis